MGQSQAPAKPEYLLVLSLKLAPVALPGTIDSIYQVEDLLGGDIQTLSGTDLTTKGFTTILAEEGSTVFSVRRAAKTK